MVLLGIAACCFLMYSVTTQNIWRPLFVSCFGLVVAKWHLLELLEKRIGHFPIWAFAGIILVVALFRQLFVLICYGTPAFALMGGGVVEALVVVPFIFSVVTIKRRVNDRMEHAIALLGDNSMNLWFIHGIFFTGACFLQPYLYAPRFSVLVYAWGLICLLPIAWILKFIQSKIRIKF